MNDMISRQAVFDALGEPPVVLWEYMDDYTLGTRNQYDKDRLAIETVPSAQRWIPCKERMPKSKEYEDDVLKYYLVQNEFGDMMVCSWNGKYWEQMYQYKNVRDKVVAWMPLPDPWKGKNENDRT